MLLSNRILKCINIIPIPKYKFSMLNISKIKNTHKINSLHNKLNYQMMVKYQFANNTKLTKQEIEQSSYDQLVQKITNIYNYKQYRIPSALALLQLHHNYKIFKAGDWVLDIGAGPHMSWTDLALKLTRNPAGTQKVISNDVKQVSGKRDNNLVVVGNFMQEPVRTKIAMELLNRQLDTILIDATPQYTGKQQVDASYTLQIFVKALQFAQNYLKKGGTIVFKTIQSTLSLQNQNQAKFFFNQVYRYKPNNFRITSPAFFYVLKGYMMNDNVKGVQNLLKQYKKAKNNYSKMKVIQKYRQLYKWDPVMIIVNEAQQAILEMKNAGKKNNQIAKLYQDDPYVKVNQILESLSILQDKNSNVVDKINATSKLLTGKNQQNINEIAKTQEQFAEILFKHVDELQKQQQEDEKKAQEKKDSKRGHRKNKKANIVKIQQKAPLGQNQVYMKSTVVKQTKKRISQQQEEQNNYWPQDLYGYNPQNPQQSIHRRAKKSQKQQKQQQKIQLFKLSQSFPQIKYELQKNKNNFDQVLKQKQSQFAKKFKDLQGFSAQKDEDEQIQDEEQIAGSKKKKSTVKKDQYQQSLQQVLLNNKKKSKKQPVYEWQNLSQQQQIFPGSIKSKLNRLSKESQRKSTHMSSEFDFNDMIDQQKKIDQEQLRDMDQEQTDKANKVQYLNTKPSKANRPINYKKNRAQGGSPLNYFKNKNKKKQ